jgi:hypothetical protein
VFDYVDILTNEREKQRLLAEAVSSCSIFYLSVLGGFFSFCTFPIEITIKKVLTEGWHENRQGGRVSPSKAGE